MTATESVKYTYLIFKNVHQKTTKIFKQTKHLFDCFFVYYYLMFLQIKYWPPPVFLFAIQFSFYNVKSYKKDYDFCFYSQQALRQEVSEGVKLLDIL